MRPAPSIRASAAGLALAVALLAGAAAAEAPRGWEVVPAASEVAFDFVLDGKPRRGRFTRVSGDGRFDPEAPQAAELTIRIASASIDLGNGLFSAFAQSAEWFDAKNHPEVVFRLARLEPIGDGRFAALGDLSIKGRTRPARGELALEIGAGRARATGRLEVDRVDYLLGVGPSALVVDIDREVAVAFDLAARPAGR